MTHNRITDDAGSLPSGGAPASGPATTESSGGTPGTTSPADPTTGPVTRTRKDGTTWTSWGPARGEGAGAGRGPATGVPGNAAALTAGHRSPRVYSQVAAELAGELLAVRPDLDDYPAAVARWAEHEARALLLRRHLAEVGELDDDGQPREGLLKWLSTFENNAEKAAALLGLDPRSHVALIRERASAGLVSMSLESIAAAGRDTRLAWQVTDPHDPADPTTGALARVIEEGRAAVEAAANRTDDDENDESDHDDEEKP